MDQITAGRPRCSNDDVALKSFFLGPQAENKDWVQYQIFNIFKSYFEWRAKVHPDDGSAISIRDQDLAEFKAQQDHTEELLTNLAHRFEAEIPKFSPRYIGHMFSEISLPALFGHILTVLHNPNNISVESARVGVEIENEALLALAGMVGFAKAYGHFTSGGTVANFEMLFRARARAHELYGSSRDAVLMVPAHKHYSWTKGAFVFGIENLWTIPLDESGHLDIASLERLIDRANAENKPILGVVSVAGTTEMGLLDPIHKIADLLETKKSLGKEIWHHVDAAYGAFFRTLLGDDEEIEGTLAPVAVESLAAMSRATSITMDPHKLGYVPYASGVFLCRQWEDYRIVAFSAPYVDFSEESDKGLFTLEGSRSASGAVATWMTAGAVGFNQSGYGRILARTIRLRRELSEKLSALEHVRVAPFAETNLLCFALAKLGEETSATNARTLALYVALNQAGAPFTVSKTRLAFGEDAAYEKYLKKWSQTWNAKVDSEDLLLIRLCIMNPFLGSKELKSDLLAEFVEFIAGATHR